MLDVKTIKNQFPIFKTHPNLVYLDSTATSLKPQSVINKEIEYYQNYSANVFRGIYKISEKATKEYEETREIIAKFINAKNFREIIFTRNTTESINLIAYSLGRKIINKDDEIVTTIMEHHSNFVPWQQLALENGAIFKVIDITEEGYLNLDLDNIKYSNKKSKIANLRRIISKRTKILAFTYVSNVLGTINPVKEIIETAKKINPKIIIIVDAAQAVPHMKVDVADLGCDFLVFSSHKMLGPTGVGILWGRYDLLIEMFPFNFGGEMISEVYLDKTIFKPPPHKFEAGTPAIAQVSALKEGVRFLEKIGLDNIHRYEKELVGYGFKSLRQEFREKIKIFGPENINYRSGIIAFTFDRYHPHDVAQILDGKNICIRAGHHCAMLLHQRLGIFATARASFYLYNTKKDIDKLVEGLKKVKKILR